MQWDITKDHAGDFQQGDASDTYTITVTNAGTGPTNGTVTVTDPLPTGLSPTEADNGTINGWSVSYVAQTVTATRSDVLAAGDSYPDLTLTVAVADNAPASVTNTATVSGGRALLPATATDLTTILYVQWDITKDHVGDFQQGDASDTYTITVTNTGTGPTNGSLVTVTDPLPTGLSPTAADNGTINGWSVSYVAQTITATRSDVLAAGDSYPDLTLTVAVADNAPASVTNTATVSGGGALLPATATDLTTILYVQWNITKDHVGDFQQGDASDTYTITVTNAGTGPTNGSLVTVTDPLPTGLSPTAADNGTINGWSVSYVAQTITATRSDVLAAGGSYPDLTLTVAVADNAPASVTNTATVSGGGGPPATATNPTTIVPTVLSSLSGYVFDDAEQNGVYYRGSANPQDNEFGLPDVTISLFLSGGATAVQATTTGSDGLYDFEGLAAGTYQIVEQPPADFRSTKQALGGVLPLNVQAAAPTPQGQIGTNQFSDITLSAGEEGVNYNFGEVPTAASITKRMYLARSSSRQEIYGNLGVTAVTVTAPAPSDTISATVSNQLVTVTTVTSGGTSTTQSIPTSTANVVLIDASTTNQPVTITDQRTNVLASSAPTDVAVRRADAPVTADSAVDVVNARQVTLNAVKGSNGLAVMYDSPGNDTLTATAGTATLTIGQSPNPVTAATGFDTVQAYSVNGGNDTVNKQATLDYLLQLYGNWLP